MKSLVRLLWACLNLVTSVFLLAHMYIEDYHWGWWAVGIVVVAIWLYNTLNCLADIIVERL